jgi:hypothetical protein
VQQVQLQVSMLETCQCPFRKQSSSVPLSSSLAKCNVGCFARTSEKA